MAAVNMTKFYGFTINGSILPNRCITKTVKDVAPDFINDYSTYTKRNGLPVINGNSMDAYLQDADISVFTVPCHLRSQNRN